MVHITDIKYCSKTTTLETLYKKEIIHVKFNESKTSPPKENYLSIIKETLHRSEHVKKKVYVTSQNYSPYQN